MTAVLASWITASALTAVDVLFVVAVRTDAGQVVVAETADVVDMSGHAVGRAAHP